MIRSESLKALAPALVAAQKKMGAALKDAKNPFFKSKFADLNSVIEASVPVLNAEDIAVLQTPAMNNGKQVMQTILLHASGEYIVSETEVVAAKANDPQSAGSALSYSRRYGLQSTVTLRAEDDDGEASMGRPAAKTIFTSPARPLEEARTLPTELAQAKKKVSFSKKALETTQHANEDSDL